MNLWIVLNCRDCFNFNRVSNSMFVQKNRKIGTHDGKKNRKNRNFLSKK